MTNWRHVNDDNVMSTGNVIMHVNAGNLAMSGMSVLARSDASDHDVGSLGRVDADIIRHVCTNDASRVAAKTDSSVPTTVDVLVALM